MGTVAFPPTWFANVSSRVEEFIADGQEAVDVAQEYLQGAVQERARQDPNWSDMADNIEVWSDDGVLWVGVNHQEFASQAMAIEYGDETRPPAALFRTLTEEYRAAQASLEAVMKGKGYTYGTGIGDYQGGVW